MFKKIKENLVVFLLFVFPIHVIYIYIKNFLYDNKYINPVIIQSKIISVGNISLGGTGKTPFTISISNFLKKKGFAVGVITRGHGRNNIKNSFFLSDEGWRESGDEAIIFKNNLDTSIPIYVSSDKVMAAKKLSEVGCDVIIVDDGFQHRKLHRDINICLVDPDNQQGKFLSIFPYGKLREPINSLKRSDIVVSTKSNLSSSASNLREDFSLDLNFKNEILCTDSNRTINDVMHMKNILSICAIGDPNSYKKSLGLINVDVKYFLDFPDHHSFTKKDVESINKIINNQGIDNIICTEKDYIKLEEFGNLVHVPIHAIVLEHNLGSQLENEILGRLN